MRRLCLMGALLAAGCAGIEGPRVRSFNPQQVDDPRLTIEEQERRERDRLAIPDESRNVGPPTYFVPPTAPDPSATRGR